MSVPVKGSFIGTNLTNRMNLVGDGRSGFIAGSRRAPDHQGIALAPQYNMHCAGRDIKTQANTGKNTAENCHTALQTQQLCCQE